MQTLNGGNNKE